jgi:hypothetical protein
MKSILSEAIVTECTAEEDTSFRMISYDLEI